MSVFFSGGVEDAVSCTSLGLVCCSLLFLGLLARFRQTAIIKAHSFAFLSLSVFGALLSTLAVFTWPLDSPPVLCKLRPWAWTVPLYLLLCPLLAKHYRIHRIFNLSTLTASKWGVSDSHVGLLSFSLILPQIAINAVWQALAPLTSVTATLSSGQLIRDCAASHESSVFAWLSVGYLAVLLSSAVYLTWRVRHLAQEFNQSKDILSCALLILGAAAVIIALQLSSQTDYVYRYCIRSFGLMGVLIAWQLLIMLPKLQAVRREQRGGAEQLAAATAAAPGGISRLPLSPQAMKQIAAFHSAPPSVLMSAMKKDLNVNISISSQASGHFASPRIRQQNGAKYPALSALISLMTPAEGDEEKGSGGSGGGMQRVDEQGEVELAVDRRPLTSAAAAVPPQPPPDINSLNRFSVSQQQQSSAASTAASRSNRAAGHSRSKTLAAAALLLPTPVTPASGSRGRLDKGAAAGRDDRLPSMKQLKASLLDSLSESGAAAADGLSPTSASRQQARQGKLRVAAEHPASSSLPFKLGFEDHVSPLYTPAAITVEPVPTFMQE